MKNIYIIGVFFATICYGQVGINTNTPAKTLDVNGTLNVRKEIRTGGTPSAAGDAGTSGQIFAVASSTSDTWKTFQIANGTGSLSLYYLNTVKDNVGIEFTQSGSTGIYTMDAPYSATDWSYIPGITDSFVVTRTDNKSKAILSFQTTVQIARRTGLSWTTGSASYACGIFVEKDGAPGVLKAVRNDVVRGVPGVIGFII
jgi:hypothetical protein